MKRGRYLLSPQFVSHVESMRKRGEHAEAYLVIATSRVPVVVVSVAFPLRLITLTFVLPQLLIVLMMILHLAIMANH